MGKQLAGERRKQVLEALNDNGPLSVAVLGEILRPKTQLRGIRKVVQRLKEQGLLTVHFESMPYASGHFYRISHDLEAREKIARWLGISTADLRQPKFFSKELQHTTKCALWAAFLRNGFPDAVLVRDLKVIKRRIYRTLADYSEQDRDMVPDIVLSFLGEMVRDTVSIGFEIERTRKSDKRLAAKLSKVISHSVLDGVVYVCEAGGIKDSIRGVLERQQLLQAPRIRHYGSAFILFTDNSIVSAQRQPKLYNVEGKAVSLSSWITTLRKMPSDFRRDSHFLIHEFVDPSRSTNQTATEQLRKNEFETNSNS